MRSDYTSPPLKGEGWGSPEATQMVLNNLFFVSARFGDDHPKELQEVWSAMVECWSDNMRCIIRYLIIITGMTPERVLPFVCLSALIRKAYIYDSVSCANGGV